MEIGTVFTLLWAATAIIWLVVEFTAIFIGDEFEEDDDHVARGTFSWHIWFMRSKWYLRGIAFAIWGWAFYHFFFEPEPFIGRALDDIILWIGLWVIGTVVVKPRKHFK